MSAALTWALANLSNYGAGPERLSVFGHSAGAHLLMLALLHRAAAVQRNTAPAQGSPPEDSGDGAAGAAHGTQNAGGHNDSGGASTAACTNDARMPARAILAAGVYDIQMHYEYEAARGVHMLSTMERAMGGWHASRARSPALLVKRASERSVTMQQQNGNLKAVPAAKAVHSSGASVAPTLSAVSNGDSSARPGRGMGNAADALRPAAGSLAGTPASALPSAPPVEAALPDDPAHDDVVPSAALLDPQERTHFAQLFERSGGLIAHRTAGAVAGAPVDALTARTQFDTQSRDAAERFAAQLHVQDVRRLPPLTLMTGTADLTVPWYETVEMHRHLQEAGAPAQLLMYNNVAHIDWVTGWQSHAHAGLLSFQRDVVALAKSAGPTKVA